ncbi:MAG: hypothetical protein VYE53_02165, partial [Planctomycetota bacterium]|nr:hypothetical protein [Planctomycetota bacterium]
MGIPYIVLLSIGNSVFAVREKKRHQFHRAIMSGVLEGECSSLEEAIQKADTLIEAMGWIRQFRDKITVIKLGGSILDDQES